MITDPAATVAPSPTVTGHHHVTAIAGDPQRNREFYTGFLGELNMKTEVKRNSNRRNQENQAYGSVVNKTALFVNLRCMKIEDKQVNIYVCCGITRDSNAEEECE